MSSVEIFDGNKGNYKEDDVANPLNYYGLLKSNIENYLINSVKDLARIVTKSKTRDDEQQKKHSDMVQTMIDEYDYNAASAEEILAYAANNLWRDS